MRARAAAKPRDGLARYRAKRDFRATPEPRGGAGAATGHSFVVQKHAARRLHYDFRLELDGLLKSWAVTKAPSLDPAVRRLAVHVEDHPLEYAGFEGVIPKGEYGGGTVMIWDRGTWEPEGDAAAGYAKGRLRFTLHGRKLTGRWTLVRMGGKAGADGNWLLIKARDEAARPGAGDELVDAAPRSVATGRSLDEIAAQADRVWTSQGERTKPAPRAATGGKAAPMPAFVPPQLATLVERPPDGPEWLHEIKFDGYRLLCRIDRGRVQLLTRTGQDWTHRFPTLAKAVPTRIEPAMIDGEAVVMRSDGVSSFQALQEALSAGRDDAIVFYAFDLLFADGADLRGAPLETRKARLAELLRGQGGDRLRVSTHIDGRGAEVWQNACDMALEGVVSKRRDAPYRSGRGPDWLKTKCGARQEFVIGGYTGLATDRRSVGALLLGHYEDGVLVYAGKVGTGFTAKSRRALHETLAKLRRKTPPFASVPGAVRRACWVEPRLVAEIAHAGWTRDGRLRHPAFQGLRQDKPARDVAKDAPKRVRAKSSNAVVAGVALTHADRVLYPEQGVTKRDLAEYYAQVAEAMLPHVAGRPLTLVRCPGGRGGQCFYQKHPGPSAPERLRRTRVAPDQEQLVLDDVAGLVALVQIGVLELHLWGSRADDLERPDRIVFDIDPDAGVAWSGVLAAARELRERLARLKLESFVKTTGGKGLHVVVPVAPALEWPAVKDFAKGIAEAMAGDSPGAYTTNMRKAERKGRIFIDYLRNDRGATAVAPFSTRARPGAPVATPISWRELATVRPAALDVATVPRRVRTRDDPWAEMARLRQTLPAPASAPARKPRRLRRVN
jgi:bifunctional non-homologous end joining protein LigD